jgi:hypothetical protein
MALAMVSLRQLPWAAQVVQAAAYFFPVQAARAAMRPQMQ